MKKTRILSLLLCLSIFCTLIVPGTRAYAESDPDNGMKISKTATANKDGSYTITLEAFATGSKTTTVQEKDIPTDIILVLDQSGSMADDIGQVQYTAYTGNNTQNKSNYEKRHNGGSANLWHKLPDGSFVSVSVTLQQTITHNKITKGRNDNGSTDIRTIGKIGIICIPMSMARLERWSIPVSAIAGWKTTTANTRLKTELS